jgi:DNA primase
MFQLTILEVADHLDIRVDKQGKALCPFHDDKTPSLQFSKEKNICTCFSSKCDAGTMDIIGLTEKKLNLNTHEAIMQLKEWAGHTPTNGHPKPRHGEQALLSTEQARALPQLSQVRNNQVNPNRIHHRCSDFVADPWD